MVEKEEDVGKELSIKDDSQLKEIFKVSPGLISGIFFLPNCLVNSFKFIFLFLS